MNTCYVCTNIRLAHKRFNSVSVSKRPFFSKHKRPEAQSPPYQPPSQQPKKRALQSQIIVPKISYTNQDNMSCKKKRAPIFGPDYRLLFQLCFYFIRGSHQMKLGLNCCVTVQIFRRISSGQFLLTVSGGYNPQIFSII